MVKIAVGSTRQRFVLVLLCVGLTVLSVAGWSAYQTIYSVSSSSRWVEHTLEVQSQLSVLSSKLLESQNSWRAYLLSGTVMSPMEQQAEMQIMVSQMQNIRELTRDNPRQQINLEELEKLRARRRAVLDLAFQQRGVKASVDPKVAESVHGENELLDSMRKKLMAMQDEENELLIARQHTARAAYQRSSWAILIESAVALLLVSIAVFFALIEMARQDASEKNSRLQARNLQAILDGLGEGVIVSRPDGEYSLFNRAARRILHMSEEEVGNSLWGLGLEMFASDGTTPVTPTEVPLALAIRGSPTDNVELHVRHKPTDSRMIVSITGRPLEWEDGRTAGVVVFRDVTENKRREIELKRQSQRLEDANRELEFKNREIAAFYHTLSHELKTPLASAREFVAILLDGLTGTLTEEQRQYLDLAKHSCDQMTFYINDLLDMSRLETGKLDVRLDPLELSPVLETSVALFQPSMEEKGIRLRMEMASRFPAVSMDAKRVGQVLGNLLSNARKYTPAQGEVVVSASECATDETRVVVSVSNTGPEIELHHLERIFDRLYQIRKSDATVEGGLGLGLYICKQIILAHGGDIRAQNLDGKGVCFTFTLRKALLEQRETIFEEKPILQQL